MIKIVNDIRCAKFITHSGVFHADDVFATAFLDLYFTNISVIRLDSVPLNVDNDVIIYDIGKGKFDHHQKEARIRDNGIKYSSFGLLFEEYGLSFLERLKIENKEEVYDYLVKDFILSIDAIDNGEFPSVTANYKVKTVSDIIKLYNPSYGSNDTSNENFVKAVNVAESIFSFELKNVCGKVKASKKVKELLKNNNSDILLLDEYLPYEEVILTGNYNTKLVIYPSNRGGYCVKTVPISLEDKNSRVYFPLKWAGLVNEDLEKTSGIKDITFCHVNRFLVATKSLEAALKVASVTMDANEKY